MGYHNGHGFPRYVSVAEGRRKAGRELRQLEKKGHSPSPVVIEGRFIASTFWGKAWCENLHRYSDFSNRLPRGQAYLRHGAVVDLQIAPGEVTALVAGSSLYRVAVKVSAVPQARWASICTDCVGGIESLVELLQGRLSRSVMARICQREHGLFPAPAELEFSCSCPDWASMCKHVAAVFYGIGARLDKQPELLFKLRKVDERDLIAKAGRGLPLAKRRPSADRILAAPGLCELFGLELGALPSETAVEAAPAPEKAARTRRVAKSRADPAALAPPAKAAMRPASTGAKAKPPNAKAEAGVSARKSRTVKR